jgi:hypothetical protein
LVAGQVVAHAQQLRQLRRRRAVELRRVVIGYGQHAMLVAPPALVLWLLTTLVDSLRGQILLTLAVSALVLGAVVTLGDRIAGVAALDRRGLLPGLVAVRLRGRSP